MLWKWETESTIGIKKRTLILKISEKNLLKFSKAKSTDLVWCETGVPYTVGGIKYETMVRGYIVITELDNYREQITEIGLLKKKTFQIENKYSTLF